MTGARVAAGLIDASRKLRFRFDGAEYTGHPGDTLASALLASGVRIVGRSFKYHRPRGVWGAWFDDPNAVFDVTLNGIRHPNVPGATTPLEEGMELRAVNAWPSAQWDVKRGLDLFHRFLGAGFYYKTFIWPDWHLFEPTIRKLAGLGRLDGETPDSFAADQTHDTCEVLVVGGGAAGLAAARRAAESGADVVLVDDHPQLGGGLYAMGGVVEGLPPADWVQAQEAAIVTAGGRILPASTAIGVYDHGLVALATDRGLNTAPRLTRMRTGRVIMATGAMDRPLTFQNNDRPGVMSLWAATEFLGRYGVRVGQEMTVLANNSLAAPAAERMEAAGARIRHLDPAQVQAEAIGPKHLTAVSYGNARHGCDTLLVSGGLTPVVHLWRHAGGKLDWRADLAAFVPGQGPDGMEAVGAANGAFDLDAALAEARGEAPGRSSYHITPVWPKPGARGRHWIDFQHDVTLKDIEVAARENFTSVEHLKRYTTLGMAGDQGKTSNMAGLAAMAALQGKSIPEVGTTTFRPPFVPVPLALYKPPTRGELYHPLKRLPLEAQHRDAGAALGEYGGWLRPGWYGDGPAETQIRAECVAARQRVALFDGSPLGKIEVMGPDAADFVNFIFYNTMRTLPLGRIRYGFILTEQGVVYDDGVVARLGEDHFLISCSSSHVDGVYGLLEAWRQDGHDPNRIYVHDRTQGFATLTLTGPDAPKIVAALGLGVDLSEAAFPHMSFQNASFGGKPLRIARVSFTGDISYELTLPASAAPALWDKIMAQGVTLIGVEALAVLRAEKGYIMVGKDTDGETMPHDLGFTGPRDKKRTAYMGDRGLQSPAARRADRQQLVGLAVAEGEGMLPVGAHIVQGDPRRSLGYVTSSYDSPTLGRPIAMALLRGGLARMGEAVTLWHMGETRRAVVVSPVAFDPEGERLNAG